MAEAIIEATNDGYISKSDAVYLTAHGAASGNAYDSTVIGGQVVEVGQNTSFWIYRGGLIFDTSDIPANATITSAVLSFYIWAKSTAGSDFALTIVSGADLADTLVDADYGDLLDDITSFGSVVVSGLTTKAWNDLTLNALGSAAINKGGTTRFGARSSRDIGSNEPTGSDYVQWTSINHANKVKLTITYKEKEMGTTALSVLRADLGYMVDVVKKGTTTSAGDTTSVIDTGMMKYFRADNAAIGKWILMTSGDASGEYQMVTDYVYSSGDSTTEAFGSTTGSGETFEVWDFEPSLVNKAIAKASQDLFPKIHKGVTDDTLTSLAGMQTYKLPTALTGSPRQVFLEYARGWDISENLVGDNGGFEEWDSATQPSDWDTPTGMTLSKSTKDDDMPVKYGAYACKSIITLNTLATLLKTISNPTYYAGQELTYAAWVYCKTASRVSVRVEDDQGGTDSTTQHAGGGWQLLFATHSITVAPTAVKCGFKCSSGTSIAVYFDDCWLVRSNWYPELFWEELSNWTYDRESHLIRFPYTLTANLCIRLVGAAPVTEVSADTDTIEIAEPYVQTVYAAALHRLYEMLSAKEIGTSSTIYSDKRDYWWARRKELEGRMSFAPPPKRIKTRDISGFGNY